MATMELRVGWLDGLVPRALLDHASGGERIRGLVTGESLHTSFLAKPVSPPELIAAVRDLIEACETTRGSTLGTRFA